MKKLNLVLGLAFLFSIVVVSSSFSHSNANAKKGNTLNQGVGNIVTIDNGQTWIWIADNCIAPFVPSTSARVQTATNGFVNITLTFQLPQGHCDIPANGATVMRYNEDSWAVINSNGKVVAKIVVNPNDN